MKSLLAAHEGCKILRPGCHCGLTQLDCPNTDPNGNYGHNIQSQSPALGEELQSPHLPQSWAGCQARPGIWGSGNVLCIVIIKFSGVVLSSILLLIPSPWKGIESKWLWKKRSRVSVWDLLHSEPGFAHYLNQQRPNSPFNCQDSPGSSPTRQIHFSPSITIPSLHKSPSKAVEQMMCGVRWALQAFVLPWQTKPQSWNILPKEYIWSRQSLMNNSVL